MVGPKHQLFLNISPDGMRSRVTFSQLSWIGLVFTAVLIGTVKGGPVWLGLSAGLVFCLPVLVWAIGRDKPESALFDDFYISAWGLVCLAAMALGGGAMSPLTAVLVLGPLACVLLGRLNVVVHASVLGLLAYAITILAARDRLKQLFRG